MQNKNIKRMIVVVVLLAVIVFCFRIFGKGNEYEGYYIVSDRDEAIHIDKNGMVVYSDNSTGWRCCIGYLEKEEDYALLYFDEYYKKYCPFYVKLSDDGKRMYLSSDNSDWSIDTYDVVSKREYENFVQEKNLLISIED